MARTLDRGLIDSFLHFWAYAYRALSAAVAIFGDKFLIDGTVDGLAERTWDLGLSMRTVQTGRVRQYVMFIVVATVALFVVVSFYFDFTGRPVTRL